MLRRRQRRLVAACAPTAPRYQDETARRQGRVCRSWSTRPTRTMRARRRSRRETQEQQDTPPVEYRWQWDGVRGVERSEFGYAEHERQVDTKRDDSCTRTEIT